MYRIERYNNVSKKTAKKIREIEKKLLKFDDCFNENEKDKKNNKFWRENSMDPFDMDNIFEHKNSAERLENDDLQQYKMDKLRSELAAILVTARNTDILSDQQKLCLKYYLTDMSNDDIAEKLHTTATNVRQQFLKIFKKLKELARN